MDIILYLLNYINYQRKIIGQLLNFICRYIPLKQWAFDDSHSPKYQKFKIDELPKILHYESWDYRLLLPYLEWKYGKKIKPVHRRSDCNIPDDCSCPRCNAQRFIFTKTMVLKDKSGVRFVTLNSTLTKIDSQKPLPFVALTAPEYWNLSRVESTLSFTNVETLNALTIFIILKKLIENT